MSSDGISRLLLRLPLRRLLGELDRTTTETLRVVLHLPLINLVATDLAYGDEVLPIAVLLGLTFGAAQRSLLGRLLPRHDASAPHL